MTNTLANLARMTTSTTGTGTITLGSAVDGFLAFADELSSGDVITYAIEDGNNREIGQGTFTISGATHTLTRSTVYASTQGGSQISLSGSAQVFVTPAKQDLAKLATIEANATADQTGAEIVTAINAQLGSSAWQTQATTFVASRTALKALDTSTVTAAKLTEAGREGTFVFRSGDYSSEVTTDTAEGIYIAADDTASSSGAWVRAYVGAPLATWFGATGDGTTDDGPAIQVAANVSAAVAFPTGNYLVRTQIVLDDTHDPRSWIGLGGTIPASKTGPGPRFVYHSDLGANPMIVNECTTWFSNLAFDGTAKGTGIAIRNRRDTASGAIYEDTDTSFVGCHFSDWDLGIQHYNRGLLVQNCSFQLHDVSIELFWDDANFVDDAGNVYDDVDQGFRAIRIENNRFHANTINIQNIGTDADKLRGFSCIGNQIDIGDMLYYGGMQSGLFSNNVVDQSSASVAAIRITTACQRVAIVANKMVGDTEQGEPGALIQFDSTVAHAAITGNVLERASQYGINFAGAVSETAITGNSFSEIGTATETTRACIRFQSTATNVAITGNAFAPRTDAYCVRGTTANNWTGVVIDGNAWDRTKTLAGIYTDNGNNRIQRDDWLVTIADDNVASITPPQIGGVASVSVNPYSAFPSPTTTGVILYDVGTSDDVLKVGGGADLEVSSGALAGTTGSDTKVTVGVSGGQLQVENRTGASAQVLVRWL